MYFTISTILLYYKYYNDGICHWGIFRSSYREMPWVGFETATNELRSDALTDRVIRPSVPLVIRANFAQIFIFHIFVHCSDFISATTFVSPHIYLNQNLVQVITWVQRNELIHMVFNTERFLEVAKESCPEWNLNQRPLNSVQTL